ncbi:hypothetical protein H4R19_005122 [Coemansia spiralis]|nr:hypothetical protein H4R19_005122 [Coemansia spiralis]
MTLRYGYLRGTFGLPYGGYVMQEPRAADVVLDAGNEHRQMFCVIGRLGDALRWLEDNLHSVTVKEGAQATFTREVVAEVYTKSSWLTQLLWGVDAADAQVIIRIGRTWDRRPPGATTQFHPLRKAIALSGVALSEIGALLRRAVPEQTLDTVCDKAKHPAAAGSSVTVNTLPLYCQRTHSPPAYVDAQHR